MIEFVGIEPREYQAKILKELRAIPSVGLFMGTGTGKTLTSLMKVNELGVNNLLVLCPAKVVNQWLKVIEKYGKNLNIIDFKPNSSCKIKYEVIKNSVRKRNKVVVLGIESIFRYQGIENLISDNWCVIVDESHKIKEMGTVRKPVKVTQAVLKIGEKTPYKIILTATPVQKDKGGYIDYYAQLRFLGYINYSLSNFKSRYCIMKKIHPIGLPFPIDVITNYIHTSEIDAILHMCCRRYECKFNDFEPQHNKIELDKPKSYNTTVREKYYEDLDLSNLSQRRIAYKTLCSGMVKGVDIYHNSLEYVDNTIKYDWLKEFISNTDEKIIIFYKYNVELNQLEKLCKDLSKKYIVINGANKRKTEDITSGDYDIILGQFGACGESIDGIQYQSHICVYFSIPESSLEYKQALGRINRDGQEKVPMYYYLVTKDTIEDKIYDLIQSKIEFNEETLNKLIV